MVSHHLAKFIRHRHCGSGDLAVLAFHVILQDHVVKGSCDFIGGNPSC